jgi:hypothetical protein
MKNLVGTAILAVAFATACCALDALVRVSNKGKQNVSSFEVNKICLSACSAIQREFVNSNALHPPIALVLGADNDAVDVDRKRVLLKRWDRNLFAQGVVILAFEDLRTSQRRRIITNRALSWADATIDAKEMHR